MGTPMCELLYELLVLAERIASARAAIADMAPREDEDINVQELLAEGSFGKVYRGYVCWVARWYTGSFCKCMCVDVHVCWNCCLRARLASFTEDMSVCRGCCLHVYKS